MCNLLLKCFILQFVNEDTLLVSSSSGTVQAYRYNAAQVSSHQFSVLDRVASFPFSVRSNSAIFLNRNFHYFCEILCNVF